MMLFFDVEIGDREKTIIKVSNHDLRTNSNQKNQQLVAVVKSTQQLLITSQSVIFSINIFFQIKYL